MTRLSRMLLAVLAAVALPTQFSTQLQAQRTAPGPALSSPEAQQALLDRLVTELQCKPGQKCDPITQRMRTRSVSGAAAPAPRPDLRTDSGRRNLEIDAKSRAMPTVDVEVYFPYNSAELVPATRQILDTMAKAFKTDSLANNEFAVIGHTDAKGGEKFNQGLSERRAAAVRAYLTGTGGVEVARLNAWGRGKANLKLPDQPFADVNRRVQLINAGARETATIELDTSRADAKPRPGQQPGQARQPTAPAADPKGCRQFSASANTTVACD